MGDPALVRALDVDRRNPYPLKQSEVESMVAYVDAPPEFLSQRMRLLEQSLAGEWKLVLTTSPRELSKRLEGSKGIAAVRLWLPPHETRHYRLEIDRLLQKMAVAKRTANRELAKQVLAAYDHQSVDRLAREMQVFSGLTPIVRGRLLQFRGRFDRLDQQPGAKIFFMQCRPTEAEIERMATDKTVQRHLVDESRLPDETDEALLQEALERSVEFVKRVKRNATHWLGLVAWEDAQYEAAAHFFDQLTIQAHPDSPWTAAARYNLARIYEMRARDSRRESDYRRAIELYRADDSPQRLGNLIRATRLEKELAAGKEPP
jgi:hypothetical protein